MAENKTQPTQNSVSKFLAAVEPKQRQEDALVLLDVMKKASGVDPILWGKDIVGFGSFHYRYASGHEGDMPVISFSPRKSATSVYGLYYPGFEDKLEGLGPHKTGKWCLYLGAFSRLNLDVLEEIVAWAWNGGVPVISEQLRS